MTRDETRFSPNVGSLYSFVETSGWTVNATNCSYYVSGGITSNYNWSFTGYSQLQWWENGTWHDLSSEQSGTYSGYGDKVYDSMYDYFNRQYVDRLVRVGNYAHAYVNGQSTSATAYIEYIVPALPPNATTVTATRNSNTSVTLSWTEASGVKESVRIERSIDGSSFAEIATVSGSATSYTDNTTAADHTYTYRIRYYNKNAYGGYSSTSSVTMSPSAPTKITVARATSTNVNVTLTNPSSVATSIQWQVTYDNGSTWSSSTSVSGSPVTSFTASTNGGTVKIRVRNVNSTGSSAWIVSDSVVTLVPPAPPTALGPSGIVNLKYGTLTFRWKHNPLDGSAQTEAHLHYEVGNQTADVPISGTANTYTIDIHSQAPGASYSWKVRTKGADPSYSDWSSTLSGKLYAEPQIYFIAQNPPSTVTALPIPIEVGYSDPQFMACASAVMTIKRDGRTVYTEPLTIGSSRLTGQITAAELLPEQGATYTVSVTARSGSTLEATTNTTFTVDYIEPTHGTVQVQNEPETGYASLLASFDNHASDRSYTGNTNSGITVDGAAIRSMTVDGKSVQDGTPTPDAPVEIRTASGVNLLISDTSAWGVGSLGSGLYNTSARSQLIPAYGPDGADYRIKIEPSETYTIRAWIESDTYTNVLCGYHQLKSDATFISDSGWQYVQDGTTFTTASNAAFLRVAFRTIPYDNTTTADLLALLQEGKLHIMIQRDSSAPVYIPYGSIGLKVSGKNRLDNTAISAGTNVSVTQLETGVQVSATNSHTYRMAHILFSSLGLVNGNSYTVSAHAHVNAGLANIVIRNSSSSNIASTGTQSSDADMSLTFTYNSSTMYELCFFCTWGTAALGNIEYTDIMLNDGSAVLPYTPYVDSVTPIPLQGNVLASLPDGTKDVLAVDSAGHVVFEKNIEYGELNGTENWIAYAAWNSSTQYCYYIGKASIWNNDSNLPRILCNALSGVSRNVFVNSKPDNSVALTGITEISTRSQYATLNEFKQYLAANPIKYVAMKREPETIDLGYITMPELADGCTVEVLASMSTPLSMVSYDGLADAESISVIRVNKDGSRTQLTDHAANYTAIVDKYAPLNTAYVYEVVTYAASGAYAVEVTPNLFESTRWFAYWGDNNIAWAMWNPSGSYTLTRPEKKRVHYAGRKWPVSYDSKAMEQEHSMTWTVVDMDDWRNGFIDLMNDGGRGVYKSCDGWVFHADFDYNATPQYTSITRMGDMSLTISRIDGEQL